LKLTFKLKLFFTFVIYGFFLVLLTQIVVFKINEMSLKSSSITNASKIFIKKNKELKTYIKDINLKLIAIEESEIFKNYLRGEKNINLVNSLFLSIANTSNNIMQLRYLDKTGQEIIRIDRNELSSDAHLITKNKLQDKSKRYYFKEIFETVDDKFWYSDIDLNIEHSKIEKPIKPVIRVGSPVFKNGEKVGILIINIFMKNFLHEFIDIPEYNLYIYDKDGESIIESNHKNCWSNYTGSNITAKTYFFDEAKYIIDNDEYFGENFYSSKMTLDNKQELKLVVEPKIDYIKQIAQEELYQFIWIMLGVILISFPSSYFFSKIPTKLKDEQDVLLSLFDLSSAVLFKWNSDENWTVDSVSKNVDKLLGYTQGDFQTNRIAYSACIHTEDIQQVMNEVEDAIESKVYFFEHKPYRVVCKSGDIKWILDSTVIVRDKNDNIVNFVGYLTDITLIKNNEIMLKKLSRTDQLTKINNRMHIDDVLQNQYYRFSRDKEDTSVILIDIDFFKSVNDEHGHLIGDIVLIEFAELLKSSIRAGDILGRWGGEEFLIILLQQ